MIAESSLAQTVASCIDPRRMGEIHSLLWLLSSCVTSLGLMESQLCAVIPERNAFLFYYAISFQTQR